MPIKSFRGLIADDGIDTVVLHTQNGSTGYRIVDLELMYYKPGDGDVDHVLQVFSVPQTAASAVVDFSDQTLLGAAFLRQDSDAVNITGRMGGHVIFDNITFNQDIYITLKNVTDGTGTTDPCNYLIKLEQVKIDLTQNTVATLKDIRNITQ